MQSQVYTIPSATTPGTAYRVTVHADGDTSCDCPDATYRRRQCKHQRLALVMWTAAGRSGALVEAARTAATVQAEHALKAAEAAGAPLTELLTARHAWLTTTICTCGLRCTDAGTLEEHIHYRNRRWAVAS